MAVDRIELAPGLDVSRVVTGLWQIADMERDGRIVDRAAAVRAMARYAGAGITTFDMADHYGSAEEIAGQFRREGGSRDVRLLTKWVPEPGPVSQATVRAAVQRSLARLATERLDLLQFHAWRYSDPSWLDCLHWLDQLRAEGLIERLGLTNFDAAHLSVVVESGIEVVSNQVSYSLLDRRPAGAMAELCRRRGIRLLGYGTVAGGLLTDRWLGRADPGIGSGTWSEMKYRRFIEAAGGWAAFQTLLGMLDRVARRLGASIANVVSRWVLDQPSVAAVIIGARLGERDHLAEHLALGDLELDPEGREAIAAAVSRLEPVPGDCGDEYRKPPFLTASGDLSHHVDRMPPPYPTVAEADGARVDTGTTWERLAGFSRAVRRGDRIWISGTTATHRDRVVGGSDPAAQLHFAIDKIEGALASLGGRLEDVVRTLVYLRRLEDWEPVARAHGARFEAIRPANTLVQADLVGDDYLVEIEAEAVVRA